MGKKPVDEYGCELTNEELEEIDEIANKAADDIFGRPKIKKHPGRPKKDAPNFTPKTEESTNIYATRKMPIEVMDALNEKMETYESTIRSYEKDIEEIEGRIRVIEGKYKVLADFVKGVEGDNGKRPGQEASNSI